MSPVEALKLALAKEVEAIELYGTLDFKHPEIKDIFDFLLNEEQKHKQLLEKKIFAITRP
jgi:rubrerythrin